MIPARTVEHWTLKSLEAGNVGHIGVMQYAGGSNHNIGNIFAAIGGRKMPTATFKAARSNFAVEFDLPF